MANLSEKPDKIEDNPLIQISRLKEDIVAYTGNEELGRLLDLCAMIISGNMPETGKIIYTISKLEAMAAVMRMEYVAYMSLYKGTDNANMKKNFAKEGYMAVDNLAAALKYLVK